MLLARRADLDAIRWSTCALSGEELRSPIVACELGALYNRERVLEYVLGKLKFPYNNQDAVKEAFGHITSARSVFEVQLHSDPAAAVRPQPHSSPSAAAGTV